MRYRWPDGHRCAVAFTWDFDAESAFLFRNPDQGAAQFARLEERRYGSRVGIARILKLYEKYGLKGSFYIPGYTITHHTDAVKRIRDAGHELGAHGNVHESLDTLSPAEEVDVLEQQLEIWQEHLGIRPTGYRSPSWEINKGTPSILKQYGFEYDSSLMGDDIPYDLQTPKGPLVEVPISWLLDDHPHYSLNGSMAEPDRVIRMWMQEFDGLYQENGCFVLTMHPWLSGRAGRLLALEKLIQHIRSVPGVWFTTVAEISRWAISQR